jgi:hypothetical protein
MVRSTHAGSGCLFRDVEVGGHIARSGLVSTVRSAADTPIAPGTAIAAPRSRAADGASTAIKTTVQRIAHARL